MPDSLRPAASWFLRHGETDWNKDNLAQGSVDKPLNQVGIDQAMRAASLLTDKGIRAIIASPMQRARVTAETVAGHLGLPVSYDPDLHEAAFGVMEGEKMLAPWFDAWITGAATPAGAEAFADVIARVVPAVNRALTQPSPVLVVAHGAVFRAIRAAMGLPADVRLANAVPQFCTPATPWVLTPATP